MYPNIRNGHRIFHFRPFSAIYHHGIEENVTLRMIAVREMAAKAALSEFRSQGSLRQGLRAVGRGALRADKMRPKLCRLNRLMTFGPVPE